MVEILAMQKTSQQITHRKKDNVTRGNTTATTTTTATSTKNAESESDRINIESASSSSSLSNNENNDTNYWWKRSFHAAIRGGASGSIAMVLQVVLLMWLRTTVNYQYKHGVDSRTAFSILYNEGGILRFYRGASVALLTGPISRFGDTAANEGIKELLGGSRTSQNGKGRLPVWAMTLTASVVAALWRVIITPLDTIKTTLQVSSANGGWKTLSTKIHNHGVLVLWDGALGNSLATLAGHYPWFIVHNFLEANLPKPPRLIIEETAAPAAAPATDQYQQKKKEQRQRRNHKLQLLLRRALIGFCSSLASDCVSNGLRVVKTYQQTSPVPIGYGEALSELMLVSGFGFVFRGLGLKILSNGLSGILFAVLWKMILEHLSSPSPSQVTAENENNDKPKKA
jgi:hypothetical protein